MTKNFKIHPFNAELRSSRAKNRYDRYDSSWSSCDSCHGFDLLLSGLYVGPLTSGAFPDWFVLSNLSWLDFVSPSAGTGRMRWI